MKANRWVRTELLPRLGMRVTYKYGTTASNASITLTYPQAGQGGIIIHGPVFADPALDRPIEGHVHLNLDDRPEDLNRKIWAAIYDLWKVGREKVKNA